MNIPVKKTGGVRTMNNSSMINTSPMNDKGPDTFEVRVADI